jgi:hypothetical protein
MTSSSYVFFLAHVGRDTERAKELRNLLQPDVSVFLDAYDLVAGDQWDVALPKYQRNARATVALLSSAVEEAYYLREEIANAIAAQRHDPNSHRLIPVFLDGTPTDPWETPYGVRVRHSLDAVRLGMAGVAAELRRIAAALENSEPMSVPDNTTRPADRVAVFEALCRLLIPQFDEIPFRLNAPMHQLAPSGQPLSRRALDLVQWAEQGVPNRMANLAAEIRRTAPGVLN